MKVLVLTNINEGHKQLLGEACPAAEFIYSTAGEVSKEQVQEAEVIIGNPPAEFIKDSRNLGLLQLETAGADAYIADGVMPEGAALANATGAYGLAISEYMLANILAIYKKVNQYWDAQKERRWNTLGHVKSIYGATALIVGLGDIGGELALRLKALGARTIGIRRSGKDRPDYVDELYTTEEIDNLLPNADIVAMSLPGTKETYHIMNERRLRLMKPDAVLVNVGRGSAVDSEALYRVMSEGRLLGACIDVAEQEPLPADNKLWELDRLIITPHISGGHQLLETLERIVRIAAGNLKAYSEGGKIRNVVDFKTGYRRL